MKPHPSFTLTEADHAYFHLIPPAWLKLLKLAHYEKMSVREIAADTGLSMGTVGSRVHRARKIIMECRAADEASRETWQQPTMPIYEARM